MSLAAGRAARSAPAVIAREDEVEDALAHLESDLLSLFARIGEEVNAVRLRAKTDE